jgi:hypothetical protein
LAAARAGSLFPLFYLVEIRHPQLLQSQSCTRSRVRVYNTIMVIAWRPCHIHQTSRRISTLYRITGDSGKSRASPNFTIDLDQWRPTAKVRKCLLSTGKNSIREGEMGAFALASKSVRLLTILCLAVCLRPGSAAADPTLTTLYNFAGNDGAQPTGRLIFDKSGALYGTTDIGGAEGSPSYGDLVFDKSGALYEATLFGGTFYHGTVFKLTPPA